MKKIAFIGIICVAFACFLNIFAGGSSLGNGNLAQMAIKYLYGTAKNVPMQVFKPPKNKNDSVGYRVYTQKNPHRPCFLEPTKAHLRRCQINSDDPLILLVPGFITTLNTGNLFDGMKDALMKNGPYTVIILDWTKYNGPPVSLAITNMKLIAPLAADVLNFIIKNAGVKAENMCIAGHSLGGHMAGYIGRRVKKLARIEALDPPGIFFTTPPFNPKITPKDVTFVSVIHTSNEMTGSGTVKPLGHFDFYPNGGAEQPGCYYGARYTRASGDVGIVNNLALKQICHHEMVNTYYIETIERKNGTYLATNCDSYQDYEDGKCPQETHAVADMGFYGGNIDGLPNKSKFYLNMT